MKNPAEIHDPCEALLRDALQHAPRPLLWIVDEHIATPSTWLTGDHSGITVLTNRHDSHEEAVAAGITSHFSDMELQALPGPWQSVVYRISKEKALVHHIINNARHVLAGNGSLILVGGKQEGIKTYIDKAVPLYGALAAQENGAHSTRMATLQLTTGAAMDAALDDKDYAQLREIGSEDGLHFHSKPGQFGWDKMDQGSRFLIDLLDGFFASHAPGALLDLGCGYGYLAVHALHYKPARLVATDNNAAALASCRFNLAANGAENFAVIGDDCGRHLLEQFDTLLCNPPFHQGFGVQGELTDRFVTQARRLLQPRGQALFVVNQFIALEQKAATLFRDVDIVARNKGFKVVRLAGRRR